MRPLMIDDLVKTRVKELKDFAEQNVYHTDKMLDLMNDQEIGPGLDANYQMLIPSGYKVVYSVDQLGDKTFDHLSISVDKKGKMPSPFAVEEILGLFEMEPMNSRNGKVSIEPLEEGYNSVNIMQLR